MVDFRKALAKKKREPRLDLNPSSADRWTTCTASPHFIMENWDRIPADDSTKYNEEGTTAHEVAAALLQDRKPRVDDNYHCPAPVTKDMHRHAWSYMEYIEEFMEPGATLLVEQKLPLWYMPERNAKVDAAIINTDSIHVIDYKYGAGVVVSPENNLQGVIYARSVEKKALELNIFLRDDLPVTIHIFQPRGRAAEDGASHIWETTWGEISDLAINQVEHAAIRIQKKSAPLVFNPSPKTCQWCPAKGFCNARAEAARKPVDALQAIPAGHKHLPPAQSLSVAQIAAILKHGKDIQKWIDDVEAYALAHVNGGGKIEGYKLVTSRGGNRYWSNPQRAAKLLLERTHLRREEVIEEKIASPAEIEKLLGKNKLDAELTLMIARSAGKPALAPVDDPRESVEIDATQEFDNIT